LVALRAEDGAVLAMVGGRQYATSQFNRVLHAHRQIGSTIKPFTFLFAFDRDSSQSPGSSVVDEPISRSDNTGTWTPHNYDGQYRGTISYREALIHSLNVPAVKVAEATGYEWLSQRWRLVGLKEATALPSAALGSFEATPLDLAGAYTVFANGGIASKPFFVSVAVDQHGELVFEEEISRNRVASAASTWMVTSMLTDVIDQGTGRGARLNGIDGSVGGKTGTTDEERDAWFVGFTEEMVVAVWVGHDQGKALGLTGGEAALPIWSQFVDWSGVAQTVPDQPPGLDEVRLCRETLRPTGPDCPCEDAYTEWYVSGMVPETDCVSEGPLRKILGRMWDGRG